MIDVAAVSYAYPDGRAALQHVSFHVAANERVGLIGPNGAGKTTLFLLLAGVLKATSGHVRLAGLNPADAKERQQLPAHVGIVFQNSDDQLFSSTIGDDVAFGPLNLGLPPHAVRERVTDALNRVGLAGQEERVPFHLSGGEKRRAALAGVLAMRPEVLLMDEPSMFLDPRGRRELIGLINTLPGTRLIAAHDLPFIRDTCSRVLVLEQGQIVAEGSPDILRDAALMDKHGLEAC